MEKDRAMLFIGLSLLSVSLFGQGNWDWWNEKVNWDGVTSWKEYLIISPSYLGPNALPVPPLKTGTFDNHFYAETGVAYHYGEGDKTTDLSLDFFAPLAQNRVGLHIWAVPVEYYEMDSLRVTGAGQETAMAMDSAGATFISGLMCSCLKIIPVCRICC